MLVTPRPWPISTVPCRIPAALVTCGPLLAGAVDLEGGLQQPPLQVPSLSAITFSRSP